MIIVTAEPERKLVRAKMRGLLTVEEVQAFSRDEQAAVRAMGLGAGEFYLLVETESNTVQTQEVMEAFRDLVLNTELKAKRIATVRGGYLTRMQTRRLTDLRSDYEVFEDLSSAEAWLFGDDDALAGI